MSKAIIMKRKKPPSQKPKPICRDCPCFDWETVFEPRRIFPNKDDSRISFFFIGEAPGTQELLVGTQFVGETGYFMFNELFKPSGITEKNIVIQNSVRCSRGSAIDQKPPKKAINYCLEHLKKEIWAFNPQIIVVLGEWAARSMILTFDQFKKAIFGGKNTGKLSITNLDGLFFPVQSRNIPRLLGIFVLMHPAYFLKPGKERQIQFELNNYHYLSNISKKSRIRLPRRNQISKEIPPWM